jgi:hypothetical protein
MPDMTEQALQQAVDAMRVVCDEHPELRVQLDSLQLALAAWQHNDPDSAISLLNRFFKQILPHQSITGIKLVISFASTVTGVTTNELPGYALTEVVAFNLAAIPVPAFRILMVMSEELGKLRAIAQETPGGIYHQRLDSLCDVIFKSQQNIFHNWLDPSYKPTD